jgi:hypothetical protein
VWGGISLAIGFGAALLVYASIADRRAQAAAADQNMDYAVVTSLLRDPLRDVPQFRPLMRRAPLGFMSGGWVRGRLTAGPGGITFAPSGPSRRLNRMPRQLFVGWDEISRVRVHPRPGIFDPAVLDLQLRSGAHWAIPLRHRARLEAVLAARPSDRDDT